MLALRPSSMTTIIQSVMDRVRSRSTCRKLPDFQLAGVSLFRAYFSAPARDPFRLRIDPSKAAAIAAMGVTRCEIKGRHGRPNWISRSASWSDPAAMHGVAVTRLQALLRIVHEAETGVGHWVTPISTSWSRSAVPWNHSRATSDRLSLANQSQGWRDDMKFGGAMFFTEYSMTSPELAVRWRSAARRHLGAEALAYPALGQTPFPGGGELPKQYADAMDPFVVLTAAGCATKTIKLGTGVLLVQQRDTIQTAKLVASIDQVSQGRFLFGVGGGWN